MCVASLSPFVIDRAGRSAYFYICYLPYMLPNVQFVISIVTLPLAGRYLERIWGPVEILRFSAIVIVVSNVISWFLALLLFAVTRGEIAMCVSIERETRCDQSCEEPPLFTFPLLLSPGTGHSTTASRRCRLGSSLHSHN